VAWTFEWDEKKANKNLEKHGVGFEEAKTVFDDPLSITILDSQHSIDEDRFVDIGRSSQEHVLVVIYAERHGNIRIISSRKATKSERKVFEKGG